MDINRTSSSSANCVDSMEFSTSLNDKTAEPSVQCIFGVIYSLIFLLGVCGNALVIASVYRDKFLQSVRNTFIVSLSCSDIAVCLTSVLITPITTMAKNWLFGKVMCYVFPLIQGMSICISTFTLTAIAIDRYVLIIHPTRPPISQREAGIMIVVIWIIGASVSAPMAIQADLFKIDETEVSINETYPCGEFCDEKWQSADSRKLYGTLVLVVQFVVPLLVIGYCYSTICFQLSHGRPTNSTAHQAKHAPLNDRQLAVLKRKHRTNIMLISMVVIFALCWFLQTFMNVLKDYDYTPNFIARQPYVYGLVFHVVAMSSTFWNPILYAGLNDGFRTAFIDLMPCLFRWKCSSDELMAVRRRRLLSNGQEIINYKLRANSPMILTALARGASCNQLSDKSGPGSYV